jgi:exodeoxyribonuclease V alpha subunit
VNNIKNQLPAALKPHCLTIHKLLEFTPVRSLDPTVADELGWRTIGADGKPKYAGMFVPYRNKLNKLPHISTVIVEESSMVDISLFQSILDALPNPELTQFIFLGDLNQLPPLFDPSILGYKIVELPVVELTHVYRQALESPIITLAHKIREGHGFSGRLTDQVVDDRGVHGKVTIRPWKMKLEPDAALKVMLKNFLIPLVDHPTYDPTTTQILCPFNKSFGTIGMNKGIAHHLTQKRGERTFEVIARYNKSYWAVGDRVIVDKREAIIVSIEDSPNYDGAIPKDPSFTMDRYGNDDGQSHDSKVSADDEEFEDPLERLMANDLRYSEEGETQNEASHIIKVEFVDDGEIAELRDAGSINTMILSYVITVHKSQGSEWENVYIILHYSHNTMLTRELLYTAATRARKNLYIACEPDRGTGPSHRMNSITRASKNPEIPGVTLAEKAEFFQKKSRAVKPKSQQLRVINDDADD